MNSTLFIASCTREARVQTFNVSRQEGQIK